MALMFDRLAHNFAKNGYYPTDSITVQTIIDRLDIEPMSSVRIFDPCCGEGYALAQIKQSMIEFMGECQSVGIELNEERADHAKTILDHCIQSDIEDTIFHSSGAGLIFLNPPYGLKNKDHETMERSDRLEEIFYRKVYPALQQEGIMVLIVPSQSLTERFATMIATSLTDITVGKAPERQFNQVIIMGKQCARSKISPKLEIAQRQLILAHETVWQPLVPGEVPDKMYRIPQINSVQFKPICLKVDALGLEKDFSKTGIQTTLWNSFERLFPKVSLKPKRQPLMPLGKWHTALALASGQLTGIVKSNDGLRQLMVKGHTYKVGHTETVVEKDRTVTTHTERFVPSIKAIDVTENSEMFGEILTIS